ncbi:unnamed protein product [Blepharisma stoltei]|uniref:Calcium uniporter protein C-terminal domain-containing protein n=1 Tax=Blepharisma stoltei TaxID=1481888 RepID=A0AAU9K1S6_9CILI|nr:unnamed protein product [Blepharisma stoltei]
MLKILRRGLKTSFAIPLGTDYKFKILLPNGSECWFTVDNSQTIEDVLNEIQTEDPSIVQKDAENPKVTFKTAIEKGPVKTKINGEEYEFRKSEFRELKPSQREIENFANILVMHKPTNKADLIEAAKKSLNSIGKQTSSQLAYLKSQLKDIEKEIALLNDEKAKIDKKVNSRANLMINLGFLMFLSQYSFFVYTIYGVEWLGWDLMEPITYTVQQGLFMFGVLYFLKTKESCNLDNLLARFQSKKTEYYTRAYGFDANRLKFLEEEKLKLLSSITLLEKRLFYDFK